MYLAFLLAVVVYIVVIAISGKLRVKKLLSFYFSAEATEKIRIKRSLRGIARGWCTLLVLFVVCLLAGISFIDLGLRPLSFDYNIWFTVITLILCGAVFILFLYQAVSPRHKKSEAENFGNPQKSEYSRIMDAMTPRTRKEKIVATGKSLTAGIYEEILCRGFLFYVFQMQFPNLSIIFIVLITSLMFGVAHFYQGIQGIIITTLGGVLLGFLFMVTGSLIPSIFLHFFVNFSNVFSIKEEKVI